MSKNILVAYFSASGVTAKAAWKLSEAAGTDLYEIKPEVPYTRADLDWTNKKSRSSVEMNNPALRPALAGQLPDMGKYDVVFVGFPIWLAYHKLIQCTLGCQRVHFYDYPYSKNDRVHLPRIYGILW